MNELIIFSAADRDGAKLRYHLLSIASMNEEEQPQTAYSLLAVEIRGRQETDSLFFYDISRSREEAEWMFRSLAASCCRMDDLAVGLDSLLLRKEFS